MRASSRALRIGSRFWPNAACARNLTPCLVAHCLQRLEVLVDVEVGERLGVVVAHARARRRRAARSRRSAASRAPSICARPAGRRAAGTSSARSRAARRTARPSSASRRCRRRRSRASPRRTTRRPSAAAPPPTPRTGSARRRTSRRRSTRGGSGRRRPSLVSRAQKPNTIQSPPAGAVQVSLPSAHLRGEVHERVGSSTVLDAGGVLTVVTGGPACDDARGGDREQLRVARRGLACRYGSGTSPLNVAPPATSARPYCSSCSLRPGARRGVGRAHRPRRADRHVDRHAALGRLVERRLEVLALLGRRPLGARERDLHALEPRVGEVAELLARLGGAAAPQAASRRSVPTTSASPDAPQRAERRTTSRPAARPPCRRRAQGQYAGHRRNCPLPHGSPLRSVQTRTIDQKEPYRQ